MPKPQREFQRTTFAEVTRQLQVATSQTKRKKWPRQRNREREARPPVMRRHRRR